MYVELTKKVEKRKKRIKRSGILKKLGKIVDLTKIKTAKILLEDIIDIDLRKTDMIIFKTKYDKDTDKTPVFEKEAILFLEHMGIEIICTDYIIENKEVFMYMMWTKDKKMKFIDGIENLSLINKTTEECFVLLMSDKNKNYKVFIETEEIDEDIENRNEEFVRILKNILEDLKNLVYLKKDYLPISLTNIEPRI